MNGTVERDGAGRVVAAMLAGAVMISFSGVWVKVAHVAPTVSAFYRVLFGGLLLLGAAAHRGEIRYHGVRHWITGMLCGLLFALDLCFYHYAVLYVGPGLGTILPNFQVFIMAGAGIFFFGERVRPLFLISIPLAFAGIFMIVGLRWPELTPTYKAGVYYGLAAAVCYAGFMLVLRKLQSDQRGLSFFYVIMMVSLATAAILGAEVVRRGDSFAIPDFQTFFALAALGLFSQCLGWIIITNALPRIRTSLSGLILLLQPSLAFVWDVLFFGRPTTLLNWIGVVVALAAIYLGTLGAKGAPRRPQAPMPSPSAGSTEKKKIVEV